MSELWLLIPAAALASLAWLALHWECHALSIALSIAALATVVTLL